MRINQSTRWAFLAMTLLAGFLKAQTDSIVGPVRKLRYVYNETTNLSINGQGTLIKKGPAALWYKDASLFRGAIQIEEGRVGLQTSTAGKVTVLPFQSVPALTNGLVLWVDASSNVVSSGGAVTHWFDVRDNEALAPGGAAETNHPWAYTAGGATAPTAGQRADGSPLIDFGASVSGTGGAWMQWANSATNALDVTNVCSVVFAASFENGGGCFFGHSVTSDFARGKSAPQGTRYFWEHGVSSPYLIQGDVFVDEERVDVLKATPKSGDQILSFVARTVSADMMPNLKVSNFGKDRAAETGGFKLYEVLVYDRFLTEAERMRVSEYLDGKWFGRSVAGDVEVCTGAELEISVADGCVLMSDGLYGDGNVVKRGGGEWLLGRSELAFPGNVNLVAGSITNASPVRQALPFALDGNAALSVVAEGYCWRAAGTQTPAVLEKSGSGEWMVTALPETGLETIRVAGGTLRFAPREIPPAAARTDGAETIFEDSFEYPFDQLVWSAQHPGVRYCPGVYGDDWTEWPGLGWTCKVNDPNTGTARNPAVVLCNEGYNSSLVVLGGAEHGDQAILLQGKGEIRKTVTFPAAGDYLLTFWAAARSTPLCTNHTFDVCVGGVTLTNIQTAVYGHFRYYRILLMGIAAGPHELRFTGTNLLAPPGEETFRASVLDGIRIVKASAAGGVPIQDAGFEVGVWQTGYSLNPTDSQWQFIADAGWSSAITTYSATLSKRGAPEGVKVAWLGNNGNFAATNVTFSQAGTYTLSFLASARQSSSNADEARAGCWPGHDYRIYFNGVACGYGRTLHRRFGRQEVTFDVTAPGTFPIRFFGLNEANLQYFPDNNPAYVLSRISLFDCLHVRKEVSIAIPDYSFENNNTVNWKWVNNGSITSASGNNYVSWGGTPDGPSGGGRAGIVMGAGQMYQDILIPSGGVFQLSFYAAGRFLYNTAGNVVDPKRSSAAGRLGHDFRVRVDDETVIEIQTRDEMFRRYAARLPMLTAGVHRVSFEGINTLGGSERGSSIDAVRLTRVETESADGLFPEGARVEVASGAVLHLDFEGTNNVKAVNLGGQEHTGVISAARFPAYIRGPGVLLTPAKGTMISVR